MIALTDEGSAILEVVGELDATPGGMRKSDEINGATEYSEWKAMIGDSACGLYVAFPITKPPNIFILLRTVL